MEPEKLLPKRAFTYARDLGVQAMDRLVETFEPETTTRTGDAVEDEQSGEGAAESQPSGLMKLVEHWRTMPAEEKEEFVDRLIATAVEVAAVTAAAGGFKLGKRAAKATGKVIRKKSRKLRKATSASGDSDPNRKKKRTSA